MRVGSLLVLLVGVGVAAACVRLGFWQLERRQEKHQANARLHEALRADPIPLDRMPGALVDFEGRRVRVAGVFDSTRHVVLAGRAHDAMPGVELVTPLRLPTGGAVLVDRGWLPAEDAERVRPQDFPEPGPRVVIGIAEAMPRGVGGALWEASADDTVGPTVWLGRRLDFDSLRVRVPYALEPWVLRELPGPGVPARPLRATPELPGESMHLGYALQWFAFATGALVGSILLARRGSRRPARPAARD